jgi:hypothetical protein
VANSPSNLASIETPLISRSSAPAEVNAEFFAGVAPRKVRFPAIDLFNFAELRSVPFAARLHAPELKTVRIDRTLNVASDLKI